MNGMKMIKKQLYYMHLTLFATADPEDKSYASRRKAGTILESLFEDQPEPSGNSPLYHSQL